MKAAWIMIILTHSDGYSGVMAERLYETQDACHVAAERMYHEHKARKWPVRTIKMYQCFGPDEIGAGMGIGKQYYGFRGEKT